MARRNVETGEFGHTRVYTSVAKENMVVATKVQEVPWGIRNAEDAKAKT
jgi:hypothetical protein